VRLLYPTGVAPAEPEVLGRYGFNAGVPIAIERIVNLYSPLVGYTKVPENDDIDRFDAQRVVDVQRFLFERFTCDAAQRKAQLAALEDELDLAGKDAAAEKGIVVTAEQMWVSDRAGVILSKLPDLHAKILRNELVACPGAAGVMTGRSWLLLGGVFVGAYFLFGGHK
jgi:hypothetical protein